ncbi:MAG: hypothetical protein HYR50_03125 [Candidatus Rokubacteria bacterium]|nr:hypothetical protein [Candidatus Rokubacteria bacterium]
MIGLLLSVLGAAGISAPAAAEEVRQGLNAPVILQMLSRPAESPEAVMPEMLRPDAVQAKPVRFDQPQMMPDGSARYGTGAASVTMTIRNPCPPGDIEHEMMVLRSLPGRGRK